MAALTGPPRPRRARRAARAGAAAAAAACAAPCLAQAPSFVLQALQPRAGAAAAPGAAAAAPAAAAPGGAAAGGLGQCGAAALGLGALAQAARGRRSRIARQLGTNPEGEGNLEDAIPFEVRGFSLAQLFLIAGFALVTFSFFDYFVGIGGSGIGALVFIYAVPVLLLGLALFYAELQPVEVEFRNGATEEFWNEKQTPTMLKVFNDTTRHRYGDDAHLDSSLKALGLTVSKGRYPQMKSIIISKTEDEELEFTMTFVSKDVPFTTWSDPAKLISFDRFFGPGIWSSVYKVSGEKKIAGLKLTTGTRPADSKPKKEKVEAESQA